MSAEAGTVLRGGWIRATQRFALIAGSVLFALALAEGALRAYLWTKGIGRSDIRKVLEQSQRADLPEFEDGEGLFGRMEPSPHPGVVYQLKPHLKGTLRGAHIETNRFGMRGPEIEQKKPPQVVRIAGLGDSHMFGWAVEQDELYMARLQTMLDAYAEPGWRFETLNFAAPGYDTVMEAATLEHRALAFEPDLVLVHFVPNDLQPPHFLQVPRGLAPSRWFLVELLRAYLDRGRPEEGTAPERAALLDEKERVEREAEFAHFAGEEAFQGAIDKIAAIAREHHLPVLFLELSLDGSLQQMAKQRATAARFRFLSAKRSYAAMTAERGIRPGSAEFGAAFVRDGHPSPLGHEAYARAIFCELWRMGLKGLRNAAAECAWELDPAASRDLRFKTGVKSKPGENRPEGKRGKHQRKKKPVPVPAPG